MLFGYENVEGKFVANEAEVEIIRYIFDKYNEYTDNPPAVLIQEVIEECEERGEVLTDEEIKHRAALRVLPYLTNEVNDKWPDFHSMPEAKQFLTSQEKTASKSQPTKLEPLVDRDIWEQVNEQLKKKK